MDPTRRQFLVAALAGLGWTRLPAVAWSEEKPAAYRMPRESDPHAATWMAYGATARAWGTTGAFGATRRVARHDLMRIAATLSRFEPVRMIVASAAERAEAQARLNAVLRGEHPKDQVHQGDADALAYRAGRIVASQPLPPIRSERVQFIVQPVDDLWVRDTAPVFVRGENGRVAAVDFNFNGWGQEPIRTGLKGWRKDPRKLRNGIAEQDVRNDRRVAAFVAKHARVPRVSTWLTLEGGGLELNGRGLALATESSILNPNRNPGRGKRAIEAELRRVLGVEHVLWLPGIRAEDITDGHIDFYARFIGDGEIVYTWDGGRDELGAPTTDARNLAALRQAIKRLEAEPVSARTRWLGPAAKRLRLTPLRSPDPLRVISAVARRTPELARADVLQEDTFAAGYVGYYEANGCVLLGQFGDPETDAAALRLLASRHADRTIVQLTTDGLANAGGTTHCATQQQIAGSW